MESAIVREKAIKVAAGVEAGADRGRESRLAGSLRAAGLIRRRVCPALPAELSCRNVLSPEGAMRRLTLHSLRRLLPVPFRLRAAAAGPAFVHCLRAAAGAGDRHAVSVRQHDAGGA